MIPLEQHKKALKYIKVGRPVSVVLHLDSSCSDYEDYYNTKLGFTKDTICKNCIILGEIANMPGHYVVVGANSQIVCGLHGDIFYVEEDSCWEK